MTHACDAFCICPECGQRLLYDVQADEHTCSNSTCAWREPILSISTESPDPEPSAPELREATEAEDRLIQSLSVSVGHRLLRDWQDLPDELKVLPMNRAFLAALAHATGQFLGAVTANDPQNLEGWTVLVDQTLAIARQTAHEARERTLGQLTAVKHRALVPEPKSIM